MGSNDTVDCVVAVHVDRKGAKAIRISEDGDDAHGQWVPNSQISMKHYNLQFTRGKDGRGAHVSLPIAIIRIPEWLAKEKGLV